jgi:predicted transcriptional regulator
MVNNDNKLYHEYLIRLDDDLSTRLVHFSKENDMKIVGTIRRSLRQFFENEELKKNDQMDENRNK